MEGPHHVTCVGAGVEEVQRAGITMETQADLLPSFGVTDLPQVPGFTGCVLCDLKRGDDGEVGGKSIWINVAGRGQIFLEYARWFRHKQLFVIPLI